MSNITWPMKIGQRLLVEFSYQQGKTRKATLEVDTNPDLYDCVYLHTVGADTIWEGRASEKGTLCFSKREILGLGQAKKPYTFIGLEMAKVTGWAESAGCICKRCNSKNEFAAPNQKDGGYICFECR